MTVLEDILYKIPFPCAETAFRQPPTGVYGIYGERISADGSDYDNEVADHTVTLELYEPVDAQDPAAHTALRELLDSYGFAWQKDYRMWYNDVQRLCTTYIFSYKERF